MRLMLAVWLGCIAFEAAGQQVHTKPLYLWSNPDQRLSRTPANGVHNSIAINGSGASATWALSPPLQTSFTLQSDNATVRLWLTASGPPATRRARVLLSNSSLGIIASVGPVAIDAPTGAPAQSVFTLTIPPGVTAPAGSTFSLTVINETNQANRVIHVHPLSAGNNSHIELRSATVINVDSVQTYDAPYSAGAATASFGRGASVYVRAVVSDPFGSFDITGASVSILDPAAGVVIADAAMSQVADSGAVTKTYEYPLVVPANAALGTWAVRVVAREGTENTVTDLGVGTFSVVSPALNVRKTSQLLTDPVNDGSNPKRIPGSVQIYSITVTNSGTGAVDADTLVITDRLPAGLALYVATSGGDPVRFVDGPTASGLSFSYPTDVAYSSQPGGGPPYNYIPSPDTDGFDANITGVRIAAQGQMSGTSAAGTPSFTVRLTVRVN